MDTTSKKPNDSKIRARQLAVKTIRFINEIPQNLSMQIISKQLIRSITSIGANIIEAQASSSKKDFINFFHYALKSANESLFWFELIKEIPIQNQYLPSLIQETLEISNILGASLLTLKNKR